MKTLVEVRAAGRLADRVEPEVAQLTLKHRNRLEVGFRLAKPFRETAATGATSRRQRVFDTDETIQS
jgi:hypothetical protein